MHAAATAGMPARPAILARLHSSVLTPRMAGLRDRIRRAARPALHTLTPVQARAAYVAGAEVLDLPRAPLGRVQALDLPAPDGRALAARLYAVDDTPRPALLYLHGGGFVIGGLDTHDSLCRQLALRSGWAVVSLDYRLALALQMLITPGTAARADTASHRFYAQGFLLDAVDRLRAAGVLVQLEQFRGVTHDFIKMGRVLPEATLALEAAAQALKTAAPALLSAKGSPTP